jgi:DNA-binding NarL/FixJ family response regulator
MINLLIADDHELFIDGLKTALAEATDIHIKGTAKNGYEALKELRKNDCDIVLLDVNMPGMNGIDCARRIFLNKSKTKVLILSQFGDKKLVEKLAKYNIYGYLLKNSPKEEIIKAIRNIYNDKKYFSEDVRSNDYYRTQINSRFDFYKCSFSKREKQVLELICKGLINSEIADKLNISTHSVETFRQRIYTKSGMRNIAELVKWAIENDLVD